MSTPESRLDYRARLQQKYDKDLPTSIEKLEEEIMKLRQLQARLRNERRDVGLEIQYQEKSLTFDVNLLIDMPQLTWRKIMQLCQADDNDVWSLCLACPDVDTRFIRDCPGVKESLVVNKVVAVMTRSQYLTRDDLLKCLKSGLQRLENSTAQSWRYLKNTVVGRIVELNDSRAILRFMEDANREENVWNAFIGKTFKLDGSNLQTPNEQKDYFTTINAFLKRYGKFIFHIDMSNIKWTLREWDGFVNMKNLFCTLPNIQHFKNTDLMTSLNISSYIDHESKRSVTSFIKIEDGIHYKVLAAQCHVWNFRFWELQYYCTSWQIIDFKNVKVLDMRADNFIRSNYESFQQTNFANLVNVEKLILRGTKDHLRTLTLLEKFPKVRDVTLDYSLPGYGEATYDPPPRAFPFVRKLTLLLDRIAPAPLDEIPNLLPSLRSFCLRAEMNHSELKNLLKEWKNRGSLENYVIDIYDLYADGESLSRSNIWQHMENLNALVVESSAEQLVWEPIPGAGMKRGPYTKRSEIYSRKEGTITWTQETVLDDQYHYDSH